MIGENQMSPADVAAVVGNNRGYGYGGYGGYGFGDGFGGSWLIVFLALMMFGGWGGGYGMNGMGGGMFPWLMAGQQNLGTQINGGFDNAAVMGQLGTIQNAITGGFGSQEIASCNRAMDAMQTAYNNQIADLQRSYAAQTSVDSRLDSLAMSLQQCCCDNRAAVADLKYTVATEACADRATVNDALRDVMAANAANTQRILDTLCQDKIDAKNERIAELQQQLYMKDLAASQTAQTARLLADNAAQTQNIENYIRPQINPAYVVPNPYACYNGINTGYGCGTAFAN